MVDVIVEDVEDVVVEIVVGVVNAHVVMTRVKFGPFVAYP